MPKLLSHGIDRSALGCEFPKSQTLVPGAPACPSTLPDISRRAPELRILLRYYSTPPNRRRAELHHRSIDAYSVLQAPVERAVVGIPTRQVSPRLHGCGPSAGSGARLSAALAEAPASLRAVPGATGRRAPTGASRAALERRVTWHGSAARFALPAGCQVTRATQRQGAGAHSCHEDWSTQD